MKANHLALLLLFLMLGVAAAQQNQFCVQCPKQRDDCRTESQGGKGDADAQFGIGYFYSVGQGVPLDQTEAIKWYRKAAEQNFAEAQKQSGRQLPRWPRR